MRLLTLLSFAFVLTFSTLFATPPCPTPHSKVYDKWYFGFQGGLDFTGGGAPTLITTSMIDATAGATSISDASGNILFYSNGINVWDKTDNIMSNGLGLAGNPGYSQSALAVPFPSVPDKYYLFTNGASGLSYSVIDMTLNGGKGDVSSRDNLIVAGTTEKMTGVADANGNVWIVTSKLNSNQFLAYQVTSTGISATPVVSSVGTVQTSAGGTLKFSSDGTKAAVSLYPSQSIVEVYDFDKTTGQFSNPITLSITSPYDVEFSPDNSKLYTAGAGDQLHQFDLSAGSQAAIQSTNIHLSPSSVGTGEYFKSLKLGPDGNIYVGLGKLDDGFIGVINDPDAAGAASNYQDKAITMETGTSSQQGFPNSVANFSVEPDFTYKDTCFTNTTKFTGIATGDPTLWQWDFGDPTSVSNTATGATPTHIFTQPNKTYNVSFTFPNICGTTTTITKPVFIAPIPTVSIKDTLLCITPYTIDAGVTADSYLWSTGETTKAISVTNAGKYWVKVTTNGCSNADTASINVWGQGNKGDYNWLFGDKAGIQHSTSGQPSVFNSNTLNANAAGTSSISDPTGNLLFYTDGISVYNKNFVQMDGGTGLKGDPNSTQSSLIIPYPNANNLYYVFTVSQTNGLNYSVVDLSYNNGLGKVTQTNIPLLSAPVTEKLAGVKDDNGDFWVIGHKLNNNEFDAFKVSKTGVSTTSVISNTGTSETDANGYLKFNKDGTKAAVAVKGQNIVEVFDYNKSTGQFTNPITINNVTTPYGIEFAEDNSKLYVSTDGDGSIYQYNLNAGGAPAIIASKKLINNDPTTSYDAMQKGPDGRIYIANGNGSTFLSVISNPEDDTDVAFQNKIINLGRASNGVLPDFVANHFIFSDWAILDADTCFGMTTIFQGNAPDSVRTWDWDFGDGAVASGQQVSHKYAAPGPYTVKLVAKHHCGVKTLTKTVTIVASPVPVLKDTTLCTATSFTLDAKNSGATYLWSTGAASKTINVNTSGLYTVDITLGGCAITDQANVTFANVGSLNLGNDTTLCSGTSVTLNPGTFTGGTLNWSTGVHTPTLTVSTSGKYFLDVVFTGCKIHDTINLTFVTPPVVNLGPPFTFCKGTTKRIGSFNAGATYKWSNNAITDSITVSASGLYWLEVTKAGGCKVRDTTIALIVDPPHVDLGVDKTFCNGDTYTADAGNPGLSYAWSTGAASQSIAITTSGKYKVQVTKGPCIVKDSITLTFITAPVVNLGTDKNLCVGDVFPLVDNNPGFSHLWSNGSSASSIAPTTTGKYWVSVFQGSCQRSDTINLTFNSGPVENLPPQRIFCAEDSSFITLTAQPAASYLWQPGGEVTKSIQVSLEGIYTLEAKDAIGCKTTASVQVFNICEARLFVPTIFSPNGDGINDLFKISGANIDKYELQIFDQWGELIFVSKDINNSWDGVYRGKVVQEGAYAWKINFSGETSKGTESKVREGDVTVIK